MSWTVIREDSPPGEIIQRIEAILQEHEARLLANNGRIVLEYANANYVIKDKEGGEFVAELPRLFDSQRLMTQDY